MTIEKPLGRVAGIGLGQAIGVFLGGNFLPVGEIKGDFCERHIGDVNLGDAWPLSIRYGFTYRFF